jgi:anti-sigma regulatory factor (Ser/Thr protein kinase)
MLPRVRDLIESSAVAAGFGPTDVQRVVTAAFEAVTNAATHGSPLGAANSIAVVVSTYADRLVIDVTDEGNGFDDGAPCCMPDTSSRRGRGLALMRALMDEVRLENAEGGRVTLTKYRE